MKKRSEVAAAMASEQAAAQEPVQLDKTALLQRLHAVRAHLVEWEKRLG
jgi:hypothetical protein